MGLRTWDWGLRTEELLSSVLRPPSFVHLVYQTPVREGSDFVRRDAVPAQEARQREESGEEEDRGDGERDARRRGVGQGARQARHDVADGARGADEQRVGQLRPHVVDVPALRTRRREDRRVRDRRAVVAHHGTGEDRV